jgi:hypothetical protein
MLPVPLKVPTGITIKRELTPYFSINKEKKTLKTVYCSSA